MILNGPDVQSRRGQRFKRTVGQIYRLDDKE